MGAMGGVRPVMAHQDMHMLLPTVHPKECIGQRLGARVIRNPSAATSCHAIGRLQGAFVRLPHPTCITTRPLPLSHASPTSPPCNPHMALALLQVLELRAALARLNPEAKVIRAVWAVGVVF